MADIEGNPPKEGPEKMDNVTIVEDLSEYPGGSVEEKVDSFIEQHPVVVISKTWCPFCLDVKDLLANIIGVQIHVIECNKNTEGAKIHK